MESSRQLKMGSLFDGSGGFPLASMLCDIRPVWASEIEPFPIRVTKERFPHMKHYGDISKIDVGTLETVDMITGGSPCQDMSVAGKRQGMSKQCTKCSYKVVGNADINECPECGAELEYTRSGLFMEQIRIVKEMRKKDELEQLRSGRTNEHIRPRFMLWENVVGAFSSNNGEDFRAVLEETARIKEPSVVIPRPPKGKWPTEGCIVGDGWSVAWRVLDAQGWGVPQRRRRIALIGDFGGECAGEILFKREGLRRDFTESRKAWQGITGNLAEGIGEASEPFCYNGENLTSPLNKQNPQPGDPCHTLGTDPRNYVMEPQFSARVESASITEKKQQYSVDFGRTADRIQMNADKAVTLLGEGGGCGAKTGLYCIPKEPYVMNERQYACTVTQGTANTLTGTDYKGTQCVFEPVCYGIDRAAFNQGENALYDFGVLNEQTPTLIARGPNAVCHATDVGWLNSCEDVSPTLLSRMYKDPHLVCYEQEPEYIVRRLTPLECSRLQGFPDWWTDGLQKENPTEEDLEFWREVFETHREIVTGASKPKTDKQIIKWLQEEPNDGAMYKMWGNGIALPCFLYVIEGIKEVLDRTSSNSQTMTTEVN